MRLAVYRPPQAAHGPVAVLYYLSGLSCTEENFTIKAGAQRVASELGLMLVVPDTSPRDTGIPGEADDEHVGAGASLYVDATQAPWSRHFRMYSYVTEELPALIESAFPADPTRRSICGHSMGGHGALIVALRNPDRYRSVSAFAPIASPTRSPWPQQAFEMYLGPDTDSWKAYDTCELLRSRHRFPGTILVDQGGADDRIGALRPDLLDETCREVGQALKLRVQPGYDHNYYFVSSFIAEHLRFHAQAMAA